MTEFILPISVHSSSVAVASTHLPVSLCDVCVLSEPQPLFFQPLGGVAERYDPEPTDVGPRCGPPELTT